MLRLHRIAFYCCQLAANLGNSGGKRDVLLKAICCSTERVPRNPYLTGRASCASTSIQVRFRSSEIGSDSSFPLYNLATASQVPALRTLPALPSCLLHMPSKTYVSRPVDSTVVSAPGQ